MNFELIESLPPMVWLDLDDTVWDFSANSLDTLRQVYEHYGFSRLWSTQDAWIDDYHVVNADLWDRYSRSEISEDFLRTERFRAPLTRAGMPEDEALRLAATLDTDYLRRLALHTRLVPGALALLDYLRDSGRRLGILSNGFADTQRAKLRNSGIESYFSHVALSSEAGAPKPSAEIFRYAERLSGFPACESALIGDNPVTDIEGARQAGWTAADIRLVLA